VTLRSTFRSDLNDATSVYELDHNPSMPVPDVLERLAAGLRRAGQSGGRIISCSLTVIDRDGYGEDVEYVTTLVIGNG
jgi:hypothetical protein